VRILAVQGLHIGSRPFSGDVYLSMMCDTLSDYTHAHQTPMLAVAGGSGTFEAEAAADSATPNEEAGRYTHRQTGVDFTIRKVPMTGVIQLSLYRTTRLGQSCVAHASLHLDAVQHQLEGGLETEHHVQLRAAKGGREALGELRLKAFWMSTELERLEMELVAVQVLFPRLQQAIGAWHFIPLSLLVLHCRTLLLLDPLLRRLRENLSPCQCFVLLGLHILKVLRTVW
jgi:hypothetical protein